VLGGIFSPVVPALQTFVAAMNACGGIQGHQIAIDFKDDTGDGGTAATEANQLISQGILGFVGDIQVLTDKSMVPIVEKDKVPMIGGDLTNDYWYSSPDIFPQGAPPETVSYGYLHQAHDVDHKTKIADFYCVEVPTSCEQIDNAFHYLAPKLGMSIVGNAQISIVAPSYTAQCTTAKNDGAQVVALTVDAPTQTRRAALRSATNRPTSPTRSASATRPSS
jgi:branched-chain amino acid transport system substrate-binding protein